MTLKEAKDILKKEFAVIGLHKSTEPFEFDDSHWFGYEKPSVLEAFRVLAKEGYYISISGHDYNMRKKRLQKEYEQNTKAPGSGEEQPNESNPALKESASQFNDALLDEQAKKIVELTEENERLKDQVAVIYACKENNEKYNLKQIKRLGKEIAKLNCIIHDKNAVLSDVAEELRLSKIREKNLVEVSQKYMKEIEELNEKAKSVNMHRHKELAEKDEVIDKLTKENNDYKKVVEEFRNKIADMTIGKIEIQNIRLKEKDEVIADLTHELEAKHKEYVWYKGAYDGAQQILDTIADYAAKHPDKKFSDQMVWVDKAEEGGDHSAIIAQCCKNIAISKDEAEIIERCTKDGTELHYSEKNGFTYTNMFGDEMPIICLRGMCKVFTDEEIKNMKK